jgi:hypothetical protein
VPCGEYTCELFPELVVIACRQNEVIRVQVNALGQIGNPGVACAPCTCVSLSEAAVQKGIPVFTGHVEFAQ